MEIKEEIVIAHNISNLGKSLVLLRTLLLPAVINVPKAPTLFWHGTDQCQLLWFESNSPRGLQCTSGVWT